MDRFLGGRISKPIVMSDTVEGTLKATHHTNVVLWHPSVGKHFGRTSLETILINLTHRMTRIRLTLDPWAKQSSPDELRLLKLQSLRYAPCGNIAGLVSCLSTNLQGRLAQGKRSDETTSAPNALCPPRHCRFDTKTNSPAGKKLRPTLAYDILNYFIQQIPMDYSKYFPGYGNSLIDYDEVNKVGLGIALSK